MTAKPVSIILVHAVFVYVLLISSGPTQKFVITSDALFLEVTFYHVNYPYLLVLIHITRTTSSEEKNDKNNVFGTCLQW
jgi:hypothetical protein